MELLTTQELRKLLSKVTNAEQKSVSREVLTEISQQAKGSPRDALVLLEKIIDIADPELQLEVIENSKISESAEIVNICRAIAGNESWGSISAMIKSLDKEVEETRRAILGYLASCLLSSNNPKFFKQADCFRQNMFDEGRSGLILACYEAHKIQ